MKKIYILMLLTFILLLISCRTETLSEIENDKIIFNAFEPKISSNLISVHSLKKEVKNWDEIYTSLKKNKSKINIKQIESDKIFYRKISNNDTNVITYTLVLNSYTQETQYYLIQQIVVAPDKSQRIQYLKIIPENPPLFKAQDIIPNLTGSIEKLDQDYKLSHTTLFENGKIVKSSARNKSSTTSKSSNCITFTELVEIPCTNGGNHGVGVSCNQGYTNNAHYEESTYTVCFYSNGSPAGTIPPPPSSVDGGYAFDYILNAILQNPTFQYTDYLTDPSHHLLLQAVREWIPSNIVDVNGDLSLLNQRIKLFADNEQMFYDLEIYNQNTPNVMNAEVADYSVRVYEMFRFILKYPTLENAAAASRSIKILDLNRMLNWNDYFPIFKSLGKIIFDNPNVMWEEIEIPLQLNVKITNINLLKEILEDWTDPNRVKPTLKFKKHTKLNIIYNKIKTASNFKQYLQNFEPTFSVAHLMFDVGAVTKPDAIAQTKEPINYWIKITFNQNWDYSTTPKIVIANTFMHEMIHAEILRKLLSLSSTPQGNIDWNQVMTYVNTHNYPGLFDYYTRYTVSDNDTDHEIMGAHYINIMVNFLKQVYGNQYTNVEYRTIAWMGLKGSKAWNLLPQIEKELYLDTWQDNYWLWEM